MNPEQKTVCVMGLGYVGLPLAEAFSKHIKVIGYDIDEKRLKKIEGSKFYDQVYVRSISNQTSGLCDHLRAHPRT